MKALMSSIIHHYYYYPDITTKPLREKQKQHFPAAFQPLKSALLSHGNACTQCGERILEYSRNVMAIFVCYDRSLRKQNVKGTKSRRKNVSQDVSSAHFFFSKLATHWIHASDTGVQSNVVDDIILPLLATLATCAPRLTERNTTEAEASNRANACQPETFSIFMNGGKSD